MNKPKEKIMFTPLLKSYPICLILFSLISSSAFAENWHVTRVTLSGIYDSNSGCSDCPVEGGLSLFEKYRTSAVGSIRIDEEGDDDFNQRTLYISGVVINFISRGAVARMLRKGFDMTIRNAKGKTLRDLLTTYYGFENTAAFFLGGGYSTLASKSGLIASEIQFHGGLAGYKFAGVKMRISRNSPIKITETLMNKDETILAEPKSAPLNDNGLDYRLN